MAGNERYNLRRQERAALEAMIQHAVPLTSDGDSPVNAFNGGLGRAMVSGMTYPSDDNVINSDEVTVWRIIVFDEVGRDIIAPLLKVADLRELGVTLYLHIDMDRDAIQGTPAIYFCEPTTKNIEKIAQDCGNCMYEWVYINFTSELLGESLEYLGQKLEETSLESISHIRLFDRTLHYVSLEEDLFSLMLDHSFLTLQSGTDDAIEAHVSEVVRGVSHVLLSLQLLPVIVHSKTGAAEEIARRLAIRLSDSLQEGQLRPAPSSIFGRPLLLLVDRSHDLASALHHPFTYRGLLSDAAEMKLNIASVKVGKEGKVEQLSIDPEKDWFYRKNSALDFGEMGSQLEAARQELQAEQATLGVAGSSSNAGGNIEEGGLTRIPGRTDEGFSNSNDAMAQLVSSAPLLAEKKRLLDAHTKAAYGLLATIRERKLDVFSGVEREVLQHGELDKDMFRQLLQNGGTMEDRQRLYLIVYLMSKEHKDLAKYVQQEGEALLPEMPFPALAYLQYLEKWSLGSKLGSSSNSREHGPASFSSGIGSGTGETSSSTAEGFGWGVAQLLTQNLAATLGGSVEQREDFPLTKMVAALLQDPPPPSAHSGGMSSSSMMGRNASPNTTVYSGTSIHGSSASGGLFSSPNSSVRSSAPQIRSQVLQSLSAYDVRSKKEIDLEKMYFSQAIVFSIGGGTVAEYDDLKRWEGSVTKKSILYGCTSLITGEELLKNLSTLEKNRTGGSGKEGNFLSTVPQHRLV